MSKKSNEEKDKEKKDSKENNEKGKDKLEKSTKNIKKDKQVLGYIQDFNYHLKIIKSGNNKVKITLEANDSNDVFEGEYTLKELIKKAEKVDTEGKTNASIKALNDDIDTAKEVVKGSDLEAIKKSIEALSNIKLVDIKVTEVTVVNKK